MNHADKVLVTGATRIDALRLVHRTPQTPHVAGYQSQHAVLYVGRTPQATSSLAGSGLTPLTAG